MAIVAPNQAMLHRWVVWLIATIVARQLHLSNYVISGSYRRGKWWCNDIDLLFIVNSKSEEQGIIERMRQLKWKLITRQDRFSKQFIKKIGNKYVVLDLFMAAPGSWGNALLFTTGSKWFNDDIREKLAGRGMTWENPLYFATLDGSKTLSFNSEKMAMEFLGIKWIKPKHRI